MSRYTLLILFAIVPFVIAIVSSPVSLRVGRSPHRWTKEKAHAYNKYYSATHGAVGNSIPLSGGWLTTGYYSVNATIGTPAIEYSLLLDTGSSNTILSAINCISCNFNMTAPYDPSKSSSAEGVKYKSDPCRACSPPGYFNSTQECVFGPPFEYSDSGLCGFGITYGGGSSTVGGELYYETVSIGPYTAKQFPIGAIVTTLPDQAFGGILGVAFEYNACNPTCVPVLSDVFAEQYKMPNLYSICLSSQNGGVWDLYHIDSSRYTGTIQYSPIILASWFNIRALDVKIGGVSIELPPWMYYSTNDVIGTFVDSGTSVLLLSPLALQQAQTVFNTNAKWKSLPGIVDGSLFAGQCVSQANMSSAISQFPNINITLAGEQEGSSFDLTVPPSAYLPLYEGQYCLGIQSAVGVGMILGDVVMQNYYIVFDKDNMRLGFAPSVASQCQV